MTTLSTFHNSVNLLACIDEYDDGIDDSIKSLCNHNSISGLAIININGRLISSLNEDNLFKIRSLINKKPVNVIKLDIGYESAPDEALIERSLSIASFFKSQIICVGADKKAFRDDTIFKLYLDRLTDRSVAMSIVPLLDIGSESYFKNADHLLGLMSPYKRIKLLYDPCKFMEKSRTFPYEKWWSNVKKHVGAIVARDYKTGFGFFPVGLGQTKVFESICEFISDGGKNIIFKPTLGRRYGSIIGRKSTFDLALKMLLERMDGKI